MASRMVWSLLVKSVGSSSRYGPVTRCSTWRNDQRNDHADVVAADSPSSQAHAVEPGPRRCLSRLMVKAVFPCGWWHGLLLSESSGSGCCPSCGGGEGLQHLAARGTWRRQRAAEQVERQRLEV